MLCGVSQAVNDVMPDEFTAVGWSGAFVILKWVCLRLFAGYNL